jgi:heat shock protein HslJ
MGNIKFYFLTVFVGIIFISCEKTNSTSSQNLAYTSWKLFEIRSSETPEILTYPAEEFPYIIEFQGNSDVYFPRSCNAHYGNYTTNENGYITFSFGTMTEVYCEGLYEWEMRVVTKLPNAETYAISADKLTIYCGTTTLIFKRFALKDNILANTEWKIDDYKFLGFDESLNDYTLFKKNYTGNIEDGWGTFVRFTSEGKFVSFDQQPCGNSCFKKVYGSYSMTATDELIISIDSVNVDCTRTGADGENKTEIRNGSKIAFKILNYSNNGFQLQKIGTTQNNLVGKWYTTDYHAGGNDTIIFTENMRVENYLDFIHPIQWLYLASSYYFTYSLSDNLVTITYHFPNGEPVSETFQYILNGNNLKIKGFSNPFSDTLEARSDVNFIKVK